MPSSTSQRFYQWDPMSQSRCVRSIISACCVQPHNHSSSPAYLPTCSPTIVETGMPYRHPTPCNSPQPRGSPLRGRRSIQGICGYTQSSSDAPRGADIRTQCADSNDRRHRGEDSDVKCIAARLQAGNLSNSHSLCLCCVCCRKMAPRSCVPPATRMLLAF